MTKKIKMIVSAGQRGTQMKLNPADLLTAQLKEVIR